MMRCRIRSENKAVFLQTNKKIKIEIIYIQLNLKYILIGAQYIKSCYDTWDTKSMLIDAYIYRVNMIFVQIYLYLQKQFRNF